MKIDEIKKEVVLCVPVSAVPALPSGISHYCSLEHLIKNSVWVPRDQAEKDENFLQLIPYVLFERNGDLLTYIRKGAETRLHNKRSIGIGGHISSKDKTYLTALYRELKEEAGGWRGDLFTLGLVYDDSTAVGRVHLGVVHLLRVENEEDTSFDTEELLDPTWMSVKELDDALVKDLFEGWAVKCLHSLHDVIFDLELTNLPPLPKYEE